LLKLKGRVQVNPTESLEKVKAAVERLFSNLKFEFKEGEAGGILFFSSTGLDSLSKFKRIARQDMIRDAVRSYLKARIQGNSIRFYLNKQVAYAGHISLCEPEGESPLGPIEVEIECLNLKEVVDWLTEKP